MWKLLFAAFAFSPTLSHAAFFDVADILPQNSAAIGVLGEIGLSDPTSEGIEFRGRYGLTPDWNLGATVGFGTKNKQFRLAGEAVYNILPDYEGQVGFSVLGSLTFLNRYGRGGIQFRVGPMIHKRITAFNDLNATLYLGLPFYFEARSGSYTSASQIVFGSLWDINADQRVYVSTEAGIRLARADSYIMAGVGYRFGELRFNKRAKGPSARRLEDVKGPGINQDAPAPSGQSRDFRDSDFK
jgi:hypothetical protein